MLIQHNFLRTYRKRSRLTQADIAWLLGSSDIGNVSRCEKGVRKPTLELLLLYHVLFAVPIETILARQKAEIEKYLPEKIMARLEELKTCAPLLATDPKLAQRIAFLENTFSRITSHPEVL